MSSGGLVRHAFVCQSIDTTIARYRLTRRNSVGVSVFADGLLTDSGWSATSAAELRPDKKQDSATLVEHHVKPRTKINALRQRGRMRLRRKTSLHTKINRILHITYYDELTNKILTGRFFCRQTRTSYHQLQIYV